MCVYFFFLAIVNTYTGVSFPHFHIFRASFLMLWIHRNAFVTERTAKILSLERTREGEIQSDIIYYTGFLFRCSFFNQCFEYVWQIIESTDIRRKGIHFERKGMRMKLISKIYNKLRELRCFISKVYVGSLPIHISNFRALIYYFEVGKKLSKIKNFCHRFKKIEKFVKSNIFPSFFPPRMKKIETDEYNFCFPS